MAAGHSLGMPSAGAPELIDQYGRTGRDLRVSLTDRCNLRCTYCMPENGLTWLPAASTLSDDEVQRLVALFVDLGVRSVRFTGGEPLLRPGLVDILAAAATLRPRPQLSLTTNGIGLHRLASSLAAAGLDRINVSLDTIDRDEFRAMTRRDRLDDVIAGLSAAADHGLSPVKINAVPIRGVNDASMPDLLAWSIARGFQLRFIEQMPLDPDHTWDRASLISREDVLTILGKRFSLTPSGCDRGSAPAEVFLVDGGPATVGVIGSVTAPFCGACDRIRLTADGQVRNCLFARDETDLRTPLRDGASDDELGQLIRSTMARKGPGHDIGAAGFTQPGRPMSSIGG